MRCKRCNYRLWNLPGRSCPECGVAFRVGEYVFIPNKVEFCCPHCQQQYYGTDAHGLPTPANFTCGKCGHAVDLEQMLLRPAPGVRDEQTEPLVHPWRDRDELALAWAHDSGSPWLMKRMAMIWSWLRTVGWSMVLPIPLGNATRDGDRCLPAFWFMLSIQLLIFIPLLAMVGLMFGLPLVRAGRMATATPGVTVPGFTFGQAATALGIVVSPTLLTIALTSLWAVSAHGLLRLTGKTAYGLGHTAGAIWYASGPMVIAALPCCNCYIGWIGVIWWVVSATLILWQTQRVSGSRATLAVLGPVLVFVAISIAGMGYVFNTMGKAFAGMAMPMPTTMPGGGGVAMAIPGSPLNILRGSIDLFARQNGAMPGHAAELLADDLLTSQALLSPSSITAQGNVMIGGTPLPRFEKLRKEDQKATAKTAARALPANVVAHRLGDMVFTYHGIAPNILGRNQLWMVIEWPDPVVNPPSAGNAPIQAIRTDGLTEFIPPANFSNALKAQNALRATMSLPPLPHPSTVTHDSPGVASSLAAPETAPASDSASDD